MKANFILRATLLCGLSFAHIAWITTAFCATTSSAASLDPAVAYSRTRVLGVRTHVVVVDLNNRRLSVDVVLPRGGIRTTESFASIVSRTKPMAAITGTFFCTRSLVPVGDIVTDGQRVHAGAIGSCFAFTDGNMARFTRARKGVKVDWTGCVAGVRSGPQLLSDGRIAIYPWTEGFRDRRLLQRHVRSAIGVTQHNKLLLVAVRTPVTLRELAKTMRALGAVDAINLDGGSSTGLAYAGRMVVWPARRMTNVIVVRKLQSVQFPVAASPEPSPLLTPLPASPQPETSGIEASAPPVPSSAPSGEPRAMLPGPEHQALLPESPSRRDVE